MGNFKFHHYSLLMHLILCKNVGYISPNFIDQTSNANGELPVQLLTYLWDSSYHYSDFVSFFNNFISIIMKMLDPSYFKALEKLKSILRLALLPESKRLYHNWKDILLVPSFSLMRVYGFPRPPHIFLVSDWFW